MAVVCLDPIIHLRYAVCLEKGRLPYLETEQDEILDVKGTAKRLHCSPSHVSNILSGKVPGVTPIPHVRAGRKRLIRLTTLTEWFKSQETSSIQGVKRC